MWGHYTDMVVTKTLLSNNHLPSTYSRYATVAPFSDQRETLCDTEIDGHKLPKGTEVWMNLWGLAHDESIWSDPFNFRPER